MKKEGPDKDPAKVRRYPGPLLSWKSPFNLPPFTDSLKSQYCTFSNGESLRFFVIIHIFLDQTNLNNRILFVFLSYRRQYQIRFVKKRNPQSRKKKHILSSHFLL